MIAFSIGSHRFLDNNRLFIAMTIPFLKVSFKKPSALSNQLCAFELIAEG